MAESLASVSATQTEASNEDAKENLLFPEDHTENHLSTSNIIPFQQQDTELLGRAESVESVGMELQSGTLQDKELTEMRADFSTSASPVLSIEGSDLEPPEAMELLMCVEEPDVEDMIEDIPQTIFTPATPLPESPVLISTPEVISDVLHYLPCPSELPLSCKPVLVSASEETHTNSKSESSERHNKQQEASPTEEAPLTAKLLPTAHISLTGLSASTASNISATSTAFSDPVASTVLSAPTTSTAPATPAVSAPAASTALAAPAAPTPHVSLTASSDHSFELPVLLMGGGAFVAVVLGVITFALTRK